METQKHVKTAKYGQTTTNFKDEAVACRAINRQGNLPERHILRCALCMQLTLASTQWRAALGMSERSLLLLWADVLSCNKAGLCKIKYCSNGGELIYLPESP